MGLIGVNGAGKSTMMRVLAGLDDADSGLVESSSACNIVYVDQEPDWPDNLPAYAALFADAGNNKGHGQRAKGYKTLYGVNGSRS